MNEKSKNTEKIEWKIHEKMKDCVKEEKQRINERTYDRRRKIMNEINEKITSER